VLVGVLLLATMVVQSAKQIQSWEAVKTAGVIVLQALPLAVVVFVLFPRIESPRWRWLEQDNQAKSGLSKTLEPGAISQMSLSDELVFRVKFDGDVPPPQLRYWRGPVYSQTDGVRWTVSNKAYAVNVAPEFSGKSYRYTILMEPQQERWVFGLEMAQDFDSTILRSSLYELLTKKNPGQRAEYRITSMPNYRTFGMEIYERGDNLQLPVEPSARLNALVRQLHGFDGKPEDFIANLLQHFRRENFFYTLTPPLLPDNLVEGFLFDTRSGFCSHYATAFVYLLRIAKIPARVVGGYQGGQYNRLGGFWEVRQADAHAWAEAWLGDKGWVRFDPTAAIAPERVLRGVNIDLQLASGEVSFEPLLEVSGSWLKEARLLWQSVDYNWQRWVINYTPQNQLQLLRRFGIDGIAAIAQWLVLAVGAITLVLAAWLFRRQSGQVDLAVRLYRRFCRKLARAGIAIEAGEGPTAFADRAKALRPDLAVKIDVINKLFIRLRYEPQAQADDLRQLRKQVAKLKV
jgi:transglutaminase-like putative cysteine protease